MGKFITVSTDILIEKDSDSYRRLVKLAEAMDVSIDTAVANVVQLGITHHLEGNIPLYERAYGL